MCGARIRLIFTDSVDYIFCMFPQSPELVGGGFPVLVLVILIWIPYGLNGLFTWGAV